MEKLICDFCGATDSTQNPIISGDNASICKVCVTTAHDIMDGKKILKTVLKIHQKQPKKKLQK